MHNFCGKIILLCLFLAGVSACTAKGDYQVQVHDSAATRSLKGTRNPIRSMVNFISRCVINTVMRKKEWRAGTARIFMAKQRVAVKFTT